MITIVSSTFRNTNIRAVYLTSYIQRGNGTDTAFHRTYSCFFMFKHSLAPKRSWKISHGGPGKSWIFLSVKEWEPWYILHGTVVTILCTVKHLVHYCVESYPPRNFRNPHIFEIFVVCVGDVATPSLGLCGS